MTCAIEEVFWDDFLGGALEAKIRSERIPLVGTLEVTERCNLRCVHCYWSHEPPEPELSYIEIQRILREAADMGCFGLLLTGGEPFVRKDFLDIYTDAKKLGFWITLFTNATLITPEIADYLEEWRPRKVEVSVYGATAQTYETVTAVTGSFGRCLRGLELLAERDIPLVIKTMALRQNLHELEAMKALAARFGAAFRFDASVHPRNDHSLIPYESRLPADQAAALDWQDEERCAEWTDLFQKFYGKVRVSNRIFRCGAGVNMFLVDPYGLASPCRLVRSLGVSLRETSLQEAWDRFPAQMSGTLPAGNPCTDCKIGLLCQQCAGWSELEYGNLVEPVDYLCQVAHLRAAHFEQPYKDNLRLLVEEEKG
ncbi:MAG: radical SAM protein [Anaerolineae bacterium]|nr:radical SAM protein [Anaerolineae bacterium]